MIEIVIDAPPDPARHALTNGAALVGAPISGTADSRVMT